jgi:arsenate reductase
MAEGWARHLKGDVLDAYSAGAQPRALDGRAVKVMAEAGVDISWQRPKHMDEFKDVAFDYVVTLCAAAAEQCPRFPGLTKVIHRSFEDPPRLAQSAATEEEALGYYRRVRDEIRDFVSGLPAGFSKAPGHGRSR